VCVGGPTRAKPGGSTSSRIKLKSRRLTK
jgi:hypothetical protein